jgi:hypothetical protein
LCRDGGIHRGGFPGHIEWLSTIDAESIPFRPDATDHTTYFWLRGVKYTALALDASSWLSMTLVRVFHVTGVERLATKQDHGVVDHFITSFHLSMEAVDVCALLSPVISVCPFSFMF